MAKLPEIDDESRHTFEIGGVWVFGTDRTESIMRGRDAFIASYCESKGWDRNRLDMAQLLEIRSQPGWKTPT